MLLFIIIIFCYVLLLAIYKSLREATPTPPPISGLLQLVTFSELLLSQHGGRLGKDVAQVHQALVWCLVCPHSKVRLTAQSSTKKLVSALGGAQLATDLLNTLTTMTMNNKILVSDVPFLTTSITVIHIVPNTSISLAPCPHMGTPSY